MTLRSDDSLIARLNDEEDELDEAGLDSPCDGRELFSSNVDRSCTQWPNGAGE